MRSYVSRRFRMGFSDDTIRRKFLHRLPLPLVHFEAESIVSRCSVHSDFNLAIGSQWQVLNLSISRLSTALRDHTHGE